MTRTMRLWRILALAAFTAGVLAAPAGAGAADRKFKRKECLDCHTEEAKKFSAFRFTHEAVKKGECEACHQRHGIVPKLLLKESGNKLCYSCHKPASIGMDQPNVHAVLRTGSCTQCHAVHGSNAPHMLKAEGSAACWECHDRKAFERKNVHPVLAKEGCGACHATHASAQKSLLKAEEGQLCVKCHAPTSGGFAKAHRGVPGRREALQRLPRAALLRPAEADEGLGPLGAVRRLRPVPRRSEQPEAVRGAGGGGQAVRQLP